MGRRLPIRPPEPRLPLIPADALVVSDVSFDADDPQRIVVSNAAFVDGLFAAHLTADEIAPDALRSYFVQYYRAQMENGGFAQFVYNSDWDRNVVAKIRDGLRTIGARMHQAVFLEGIAVIRQLGDDALDDFLSRDYWGENPMRDLLGNVTAQFTKACDVEDLTAKNAAWLRNHPKLHVLSRDEMDAEVTRRAAAIGDMPQRLAAARAGEPRPVRIIRALCAIAGHDLKHIATGDPTHVSEGTTTVAWHFTTEHGHHLMIETCDRAKMFAADAPDRLVCEISGLDESAER